MVDWRDDAVMQAQAQAVVKFIHALAGLYAWEIFTTLRYDIELLLGKRKWSWSMILYFLSRYLCLISGLFQFVFFDAPRDPGCQAITSISFGFAHASFVAASLLILLRAIALWGKQLIPTIILTLPYLANVGFLIYGATNIRGAFIPLFGHCMTTNVISERLNVTVTFATDLFILLGAIIGLFRRGAHRGNIGKQLMNQGIVYIIIATIAYLPGTIFLWLNLNEIMSLAFLPLANLAMVICATRMHRDLLESVGMTSVNARTVSRDISRERTRRAGDGTRGKQLTSTQQSHIGDVYMNVITTSKHDGPVDPTLTASKVETTVDWPPNATTYSHSGSMV